MMTEIAPVWDSAISKSMQGNESIGRPSDGVNLDFEDFFSQNQATCHFVGNEPSALSKFSDSRGQCLYATPNTIKINTDCSEKSAEC
jgi:hypothetical protein